MARTSTSPTGPGITGPQELHPHVHGVTAEDVATILADVTGRAGSA